MQSFEQLTIFHEICEHKVKIGIFVTFHLIGGHISPTSCLQQAPHCSILTFLTNLSPRTFLIRVSPKCRHPWIINPTVERYDNFRINIHKDANSFPLLQAAVTLPKPKMSSKFLSVSQMTSIQIFVSKDLFVGKLSDPNETTWCSIKSRCTGKVSQSKDM